MVYTMFCFNIRRKKAQHLAGFKPTTSKLSGMIFATVLHQLPYSELKLKVRNFGAPFSESWSKSEEKKTEDKNSALVQQRQQRWQQRRQQRRQSLTFKPGLKNSGNDYLEEMKEASESIFKIVFFAQWSHQRSLQQRNLLSRQSLAI